MRTTRVWFYITLGILLTSRADASPPDQCEDAVGNVIACPDDSPTPPKKSKKSKKSKKNQLPPGSTAVPLVSIPSGEFIMGSPDTEPDRDDDEGPTHRVKISAFEMCKTEVSVAQYELVTGDRPNDCETGCDDEHPVTRVSWYEAVRFLNGLTRWENEHVQGAKLTECYDESTWAWRRGCTGYRLPTEAEWEYAARAGSTTAWSFGSDERDICKHANIGPSSTGISICDDGYADLAPVETTELRPNSWGLHEMHGNVWEWVFDIYASYDKRSLTDPVVVHDGDDDPKNNKRTTRSGTFFFPPEYTRSASRGYFRPEDYNELLGFRCARGVGPQP